jgi:hypothetical protein
MIAIAHIFLQGGIHQFAQLRIKRIHAAKINRPAVQGGQNFFKSSYYTSWNRISFTSCLPFLVVMNTVVRKVPVRVFRLPMQNCRPPLSPWCFTSNERTPVFLKKSRKDHQRLRFAVHIAFIGKAYFDVVVYITGQFGGVAAVQRHDHFVQTFVCRLETRW